jgi:hypothetical protein
MKRTKQGEKSEPRDAIGRGAKAGRFVRQSGNRKPRKPLIASAGNVLVPDANRPLQGGTIAPQLAKVPGKKGKPASPKSWRHFPDIEHEDNHAVSHGATQRGPL